MVPVLNMQQVPLSQSRLNTTLYAQWNTGVPTLTTVATAAVGDVAGGTTSILTGTNFLGTTSVTVGGYQCH